MSHRIKFTDARWFADYRPVCEIENQFKTKLGAKDDWDYAAKLKEQSQTIYEETVRKIPVVTIKDNKESLTINN